MMNRQIVCVYFLTVFIVFGTAMIWEFALEPMISSEGGFESTPEKWEYVFTVLSISALALVFPFFLLQKKIIEGRQIDELFRQSEERLRGAIGSLRVGFALYDADDRIVAFNKTYELIRPGAKEAMERGGTFEDMIRYTVEMGSITEAQGREEEFIQERLEQHRNPKGPIIRKFLDGSRYRIEEVHTPEGGIAMSFIDITELKKAEEERQRALVNAGNALIEAQLATQAKSDFLAAMSHDLRTPLNAIIGFSDFISHQYFGPLGDKKYQEYAEDIHTSGQHLLELVNNILDLSAIEAGKQSLAKENISFMDIATESTRTIEEKAWSHGIDLVVKVSKDLPLLYVDRLAIKRILLNLLSNSVKFTPEGGKVTLRAAATNEHHTIEVSDTGRGIAADRIATITDPFVKGETDPHKTQESTGLGLAIVKLLVNQHGGELGIKSKVGKGTTVTVTLPNEDRELHLYP